jgi:single-stranded DNA-binding protein
MSSYKNNVHLEGNLGKNAEKKTTPNGDVVNFSVAVNEVWKDKRAGSAKSDRGLSGSSARPQP